MFGGPGAAQRDPASVDHRVGKRSVGGNCPTQVCLTAGTVFSYRGRYTKRSFRTDLLGQIVCSSQTNGYATKHQAWANYAYRRLRTSISCPSIVQYPHRSSPIRPHAAITPVLVQPIANEESTNSLSVPLRLVSWNRSSSTPSGSSGSCLK